MRKLQPERHGQGRGELGVGQWLELGAGQCRNELTNSLFQSRRREEELCIPADGSAGRWARRAASDGPAGHVGT
jgi:hypothetical protein